MNDNQIQAIVERMHKSDIPILQNIYHYTTNEAVPKILTLSNITFRMTHIDNFEDKSEGKLINTFYKEALSKLLSAKIITKTIYEKLSTISIAKLPSLVPADNPDNKVYRISDSDAYVLCFCTKKDDDNMFMNYVKNENNKGYCIEFRSTNIVPKKKSTERFIFKKILYGNDVVDDIVSYITDLLNIIEDFNDELFRIWYKGLIEIYLQTLQYFAKAESFRDENEIRLVLILPKAEDVSEYFIDHNNTKEKNGKKYTYIELLKTQFVNITPSLNVTTEEYTNMKDQLKANNYRCRV